MRTLTWIGAVVLTVTTAAASERTVLTCQTRVAKAAERVVHDRQRAIAACLADAGRCAAAIAAPAAAHQRLVRAAAPCAAQPLVDTLGVDGIGWEALAPVCPAEPLATVGDVVDCLADALTCVADVALTDALPESQPILAARGIVIDRTCLAPPPPVSPTCGDGVIDDGEECDDGANNSDVLPDHCRTSCRDPFCGDGVVDPDEIEECEPPGTATCDDDCFLVDAAAAATAAALSTGCTDALAGAVRRVTRKLHRQVDGCALGLARCSLVDDDPTDRCLARAERRCVAAARRRASLPTRLASRLVDSCGETAPALTSRLAAAACAAEAATSRTIPRADELMLTELLDLDGDEAFPCVVDLAELE